MEPNASNTEFSTTAKDGGAAIFKYGQKVYSLTSLRSGSITDIDMERKTLIINRGEQWGDETLAMSHATRDVEKILDLLREQVEEYKESFFRVRDTLRCVEGRAVGVVGR